MESGQYQLQSFVSLVAILSAAFAALLCDFLKGKNEQLRELTIELKARREEDRKRSHLLTPHAAQRVDRPERAPKEHIATSKEKKRTVNLDALAVMERGAALAGSRTMPRFAPVAPDRKPRPEPQPELPKPETRPEMITVTQPETAPVKIAVKKDWGLLLARTQAPKTEQKPTEITATSSSTSTQAAEQPLPTGFQDGLVLHKLVESRQLVSGLVVSIGVSSSRNSDGTLPESVHQLVQSLIGANDFAGQSGKDEFLLIYPQEHGASAQSRLSQITRQLWDFQLQAFGSLQILFSSGGVEVRNEALEEAMASATERMQESKRGRKLTMASPAPRASSLASTVC